MPSKFGGHSGAPFEGMRPLFRSQKCSDDDFSCRTISIHKLERLPSANEWAAEIWFVNPPKPNTFLDGHLFELLDGYRVLAVGKLVLE